MVGALLLALQIVGGAREQARKAEALGSIESLAELSAQMTRVVHALQLERACEGLALGFSKRDATVPNAVATPLSAEAKQAAAETQKQIEGSDRALADLNAFLTGRDVSRLPPRLTGPLKQARELLKTLPAVRAKARSGDASIEEVFGQYQSVTQSFVRAIAGLTDLSDDGELLRRITSLVSLLQLEERVSQEHALLTHVFALGEFPPGSFRDLVSIISEQDIYADVFRTSASVENQAAYDRTTSTDTAARLLQLRRIALAATEDDLTVNPSEWFGLGKQKLTQLGRIELSLNDEVRSAALDKFRR